MRIKINKYKILLALGGVASATLPLAVALSCGESSTGAPSAEDAAKVEAAKKLFDGSIITQNVTETRDHPLTAGPTDAVKINNINGLSHRMPDVSKTGATVTYVANAISNLQQTVTVNIKAGNAASTVTITLTYAAATTNGQPGVGPNILSETALDRAEHMFAQSIRAQTVTQMVDSSLAAGSVDANQINAIVGLTNHMPDVSSTGVIVSYTAAVVSGLRQIITAHLAYQGIERTLDISITYAESTETGDLHIIRLARNMFTEEIKHQTVTQTADHPLPVGPVDASAINHIAGLTHPMPDTSSTGATVTYTANALSGLTQTITVNFVSNELSDSVDVVLTYARAITDDERIGSAVKMFSDAITKQSVTATIDTPLPTTRDVTATEIANLHPQNSMPDISSTGASVTYRAAAVRGLVQVVTATLTCGSGTPVGVPIALTFAAHAVTDQEKLDMAAALFGEDITSQIVSLEIRSALDPTDLSSVTRVGINRVLTNKLPLDSALPSGVTVSYTVQPVDPTTRVQIVTAHIVIGGKSKNVPISITFHEHVMSDEEKVNAVKADFTAWGIDSNESDTSYDHAFTPGITVTAQQINEIISRHPLPALRLGVTASYEVKAVEPESNIVGRKQTIIVHLTSGSYTGSFEIYIRYSKREAEVQAIFDSASWLFPLQVTSQHLSLNVEKALAVTVTDRATINGLLIHPLPDPQRLPIDVTVTYTVGAVDMTTFVQIITATLTYAKLTRVIPITLTYVGATLEKFKTDYPNAISADGHTVLRDAFTNRQLPAGFTLPAGVTTIESGAFRGATLPVGFALPVGVTTIASSAFFGAHLPEHFVLPSSVKAIGTRAFADADLPSGFVIPPLVTRLDEFVFSGANLPADFRIPSTLAEIGPGAFDRCTLPAGFTIPDSVVKIDAAAFSNTNLPEGFSIPVSTTFAVTDAVSLSTFTGANFDHIVYEWRDAFGVRISDQQHPTPGCMLVARNHVNTDAEKIQLARRLFSASILTQRLTTHYTHALAQGVNTPASINGVLVSSLPATLPVGVTVTYRAEALDLANLMQQITVQIAAGSAAPLTMHIQLNYVGTVLLAAFKAAYHGLISEDGTHILAGAFRGRTNLPADFALPATVTTIDPNAFDHATLPSGFILPPAVVAIGDDAFKGAILPPSFLLPTGLKTIGNNAFDGVTLPVGFTIPSSVTTIGWSAFASARLVAGFSIPVITEIKTIASSGDTGTFGNAIIPRGYEWQDANGHRLADQRDPAPGSVIAAPYVPHP